MPDELKPLSPDDLKGKEPKVDFEIQVPITELPSIWRRIKA